MKCLPNFRPLNTTEILEKKILEKYFFISFVFLVFIAKFFLFTKQKRRRKNEAEHITALGTSWLVTLPQEKERERR